MKLGCNTVDFRKYDLDSALGWISDAGYKYVEVEGNLTWCNHVDPWKDDPENFRDKIKSFGFKGCSCIGSHREILTEESAVPDISRAIEFASAAGVLVVATGEGRMTEGMSMEDALDVLKPRLEKLAEVAERAGVLLCIEPHGSLSLSPGGLEKILSLVNSDMIGVNFDTANPRRGDYVGTNREGYGWRLDRAAAGDEIEILKPVVSRVRHVHLKDVVGRKAVILGQGEVRIKECLNMLRDAGFQGVLSFETEGSEDSEEARVMIKESREFTEGLLKELGVEFE